MRKFVTLIILALAVLQVQAQEKKEETEQKEKTVKLKLKDTKGLVVILDGKKIDPEIAELLDPDKIESVTVIKGKEAKEKYDADQGVILIKSKGDVEIKIKNKTKIKTKDGEYPLVFLDGKKSSRKELAKLDPNDIDSIEVIKGEQAIKKYNAPNGVILVKTKKK